jgi:hypothetical protein
LTFKAPAEVGASTGAITRTAKAARGRNSIIRLICADFYIKGVRHERERAKSISNCSQE